MDSGKGGKKKKGRPLRPFSVVVPVYNEVDAVSETLRRIEKALGSIPSPWEIIVVDDGSTDRTYEELKTEKIPKLKLMRHATNKGYGSALKTGIRAARYDVVVITDADGTYPSARIPELVAEMGEHKMVVGARTGKNAKIPILRRPAKWILGILANYLMSFKCPDLNSGLRAMEKELLLKYFDFLPNGFSFTTTITLLLVTKAYPVKYIPIDYATRIGKSKIRPIQDTLYFLQLIIRTIMYYDPLKIFLPISLPLIVTGFLLILYQAIVNQNITTVSVIITLSGIQILAIGMLADLIDKRM